jgi:hypothetical protein
LALEATVCIRALTALAWVARTLVDINTGFTIRSQLIAGVTDALEAAIHVDTPTIITHPALRTLIQIPTEATVRRVLKAILTQADVGAWCVFAVPLEADERVLHALVHINAGESGGGEGVAGRALAAERAVGVGALAVGAHPGLAALVVVNAAPTVS